MLAAILNILGGLGMLGFLALMLMRGHWVRQGINRAPAAALMLASVATVMLASSLDSFGSRARSLMMISTIAYVLAAAGLLFWLARRNRVRQ